MEVVRSVGEMKKRAAEFREAGSVVAFVPTMGALHEGHLSLVRIAREIADTVVVSIFVNPTQFGPPEDLEHYPRDLDRDAALAAEAGGDLVFAPTIGEIYPARYDTVVHVQRLTRRLCGAFRPGHFDGVCTVVAKLLNIVRRSPSSGRRTRSRQPSSSGWSPTSTWTSRSCAGRPSASRTGWP